MENWNNIQKELAELNCTLLSDKMPEVYRVPQGYFEGFAATMLQRVKLEQATVQEELETLSPLLASLPKKMPFAVPEGFFSQSTEVLNGIVSDEQLPDVLLEAGKKMPYEVPAGYFEQLPKQVLAKIHPPESAKVIPLSPKRWMRYAVAAMVAGIIGLSSIFYFTNTKTVDPSAKPKEWVASKLKNVSDQELEEFINIADITTTAIAKTDKSSKSDVRNLLKDVPNSELEKFLDEIPIDNEDALSIN